GSILRRRSRRAGRGRWPQRVTVDALRAGLSRLAIGRLMAADGAPQSSRSARLYGCLADPAAGILSRTQLSAGAASGQGPPHRSTIAHRVVPCPPPPQKKKVPAGD